MASPAPPSFEDVQRNDPSITSITVPLFSSLCFRFGQALQGNHYVSSIRLVLRWGCLAKPKMDGLLRYIRHSTTLRTIVYANDSYGLMEHDATLARHKFTPELMASIYNDVVQAAAENKSIESAVFPRPRHIPTRLVRSFIESKATTLKSLTLCVHDVSDDTVGNVRALALAINTVESLEILSIVDYKRQDFPSLRRILEVVQHHANLTTLAIDACGLSETMDVVNVVVAFLTSNTRLETLLLKKTHFSEASLTVLLEKLDNYHTLNELELCFAFANTSVCNVFGRFFHKSNRMSSIRKLSLRFPLGREFESCFTHAGHETSIASSLQHLQLIRRVLHLPETLTFYANLKLISLDLDTVICGEADFVRCLPRMLHLRELSVGTADASWRATTLVRALRSNGSLYRGRIGNLLGDNDERCVQAYFTRNRLAPLMLQAARDKNDAAANAALLLVPSLMEAVSQAPRTAPTVLFAGLLSSTDSVGSPGCEKRCRGV